MSDTCGKKMAGPKRGCTSACDLSNSGLEKTPDDVSEDPIAWFRDIVAHSLAFARKSRESGTPIVGIMCEFTPRELILAAGAIPVCLCGGSAEMIPHAEKHLPSNLCPLIKSTFGYHVTRTNPFLEMADLIVAETTCDGKKKMFELMGEERPMFVLELPQKSGNSLSLDRWVEELRVLKRKFEERFKVEITPERLRDAIRLMNRERTARRRLASLMQPRNPLLSGRQLLSVRTMLAGNPADLDHMEQAFIHLQARTDGSSFEDRPRVLLTGVPTVFGAERVVDLIEQRGGLIVCFENCTGVRPVLEDVNEAAPDLLRALAEKYYHLCCSVMSPNTDRLKNIAELARQYNVDCVVDLSWQACLTFDVESALVRRLCEDELDVPYLRIQTDYSPADSQRIAVRLDALYETVRERRRN